MKLNKYLTEAKSSFYLDLSDVADRLNDILMDYRDSALEKKMYSKVSVILNQALGNIDKAIHLIEKE